ncbi:MAG: hypothetical protein H7319_19885 [Spirosoma sp.]|nr:hypothetical protein [Spirosoma sp.]
MPFRSHLCRIVIGCFALMSVFSATTVLAQLTVTLPAERMVVQRDNNNRASLRIAGRAMQPLDGVQVRAVARVTGQGTDTDWIFLRFSPGDSLFTGALPVRGGWYRLDVRGLRAGQVVATDTVQRFGVGEVFAIVGHSNAQGSGCYIDGTNYCPSIEGATDDRVSVVPIDQTTPAFAQYEQTADPQYLPGLVFSNLTGASGMAPFGNMAWFWGRMGDLLVQQLNVPVLFYNAGFGGTNMEHNYKAAYNIPFEHGFCNYDIRMPFVNLRNLMDRYVPATGIRAILLQHGENDRDNPTDTIISHHYGVIDKLRQEYPDKPDLTWIVAKSSFVGRPFENVRQAQQTVIDRRDYHTLTGPDLDVISSGIERPDGIHFSPAGQRRAAQLWAETLTDDRLRRAQPYPAIR